MSKRYALKWNIHMSLEYKEQLLNLFAQGYFSELWEKIIFYNVEATRLFTREVNEIQFKFLGDFIEEIVPKK